MNEEKYIVYRYRWVVMILFALSNASIQLMWVTYFSITTNAWQYYGFKDATSGETAISVLSIIFMVGMITLSIPSLAAFERFGFRKTVGFGVILMGASGLFRGFFGESYTMIVIATVGFAIAQPFISNSVGLVVGRWFPESERATANSIGTLSGNIGMCAGMILTPVVLESGLSIKGMLLLYGVIGACVAFLFVVFARERPKTPPCPLEQAFRLNFVEGLKGALVNKNFRYSLLIFFCLLGIFIAFLTLIEPIVKQLSNNGVNVIQVGILGLLILVAAVIGSVVICIISDKDKRHRRKPFMIISNVIGTLGFAALLFVGDFSGMVTALLVYGFFTAGSGPLILTFAAESAYPTSEATSEGLLLFAGNLAGAIFLGAAALLHIDHRLLVMSMVAIMIICIILIFLSKETKSSLHDATKC